MKLTANKINSARREEGAWVKDLPDMEDLELKVRGVGNSDYRRMQTALLKTVPPKERRKGLLPATQDRIAVELQVETLLEDWKNVTDDAGKPIPFSKETAREILSNPDYEVFRNAVAYAAGVVAEDEEEGREEDVKNSSSASAGN